MIDVDYRRRYRVRWQDVDQSGYAGIPNYIRMMEETEYAFLRSLHLSIVMQDERGVVGFYHPVSGLWLNVPGLHYHSPETILETYESVWSKDSWEKAGARENSQAVSKKVGCGCLIILASPLIFWLVDSEYAWAIVGLLVLRQVVLLWKLSKARSRYLNEY